MFSLIINLSCGLKQLLGITHSPSCETYFCIYFYSSKFCISLHHYQLYGPAWGEHLLHNNLQVKMTSGMGGFHETKTITLQVVRNLPTPNLAIPGIREGLQQQACKGQWISKIQGLWSQGPCLTKIYPSEGSLLVGWRLKPQSLPCCPSGTAIGMPSGSQINHTDVDYYL